MRTYEKAKWQNGGSGQFEREKLGVASAVGEPDADEGDPDLEFDEEDFDDDFDDDFEDEDDDGYENSLDDDSQSTEADFEEA
ncbi:MAG: hypothetical protein VB835_12550 [Pirellulales bacterium]